MKLLDRIEAMEIKYVQNFSTSQEDEDKIVFSDSKLPDMYSHNFIHYKNKENLYDFISKELKDKTNGHLQIQTGFPLEDRILKLSEEAIVTVYEIYHIDSSSYSSLNGNTDCKILKADNKQIMDDGIMVDIEANKEGMGIEFATKRIKRKSLEYNNKNIDLYVVYHKDTPIGNIEYAYDSGIIKLEDFDILEEYQRKGFGSSVLKHLLKVANNDGINDVYLLTDKEDTAKEMYIKCGFKKVGEKSEILFIL